MTSYEKVAGNLLDYYALSRGVGHTAVIEEALKSRAASPSSFPPGNIAVLVATHELAKEFARIPGVRPLTVEDFLTPVSNAVISERIPLMIDNYVIVLILYELLNELRARAYEIDNYKKDISDLLQRRGG